MNRPHGVKTNTQQPSIDLEGFAELDIDPESLDPERHYRVIQQRPARLGRARQQRYEPVTADSKVKSISGRDLVDAEGLIRIGDGILMSCPKEVFQERTRKRNKLTQARLSSGETRFKKKAREAPANEGRGVKVTTSEKE